ncbi:MAG: SigmaK-factor processing regulatory protein BofA [Firmicutes bacterium ADurb.Bin419]|nr:MAG: SigmaK-factor processing regulatory protein BofA [Firmicutes bacterium ADurb.Bin419]
MGIGYSTIFSYIIGIICLFFFGRMFIVPLKAVAKLIYSSLLGGIAIIVINIIFSVFNYHIALNPITAFIIGMMGVPGVALIVALKGILNI